jgi:8-oxo-dGTP diphosphatase
MAREDEVNYCTRCGAPVGRELRFGQVRPVCPECGWIYFADPKVAAATLIEQDGRVLLVRRVNTPFKGLWTLPAGFIDAGEDPARAAERECLEETGLSVAVTGLLDIRSGHEHERGADFVVFYRAEILSGDLAPSDDVDRAAFFERSKLPGLAFESTRFILSHF